MREAGERRWGQSPVPQIGLSPELYMRVVVYAQDLSGRRDDGYYTKPSLSDALDIFFGTAGNGAFVDEDAEHPMTRGDAEALFETDSRVTFYNADGEKVVISLDPS